MNIPLFKVFMSEEAISASSQVLRSGYIGQGEYVNQFEKQLETFLGAENAITTNSATSAEHLIYYMLKKPGQLNISSPFGEDLPSTYDWPGLEEGDEVLATPLTCTATNWPIVLNGLGLKWIDTCPETLGPDFDDLERKITAKTKLISIVHWGGYPVDLRRLYELQVKAYRAYGTFPLIVEDCAHSFGSKYEDRFLGSHGNLCTFSFQAIKHITSIDGGMLVTSDSAFAERAKLLRWYGIDRESNRKDFRCEEDINEIGFKFHMNDVSASIGIANLAHYDYISSGFKRCASFYRERLSEADGVTLIQHPRAGVDPNPWLFSILVQDKNAFYKTMTSKGISVSQVHERNDKHTCVREFRSFLPSLDHICKSLICIPCGWWVSDDELEYICETIQAGWQ